MRIQDFCKGRTASKTAQQRKFRPQNWGVCGGGGGNQQPPPSLYLQDFAQIGQWVTQGGGCQSNHPRSAPACSLFGRFLM